MVIEIPDSLISKANISAYEIKLQIAILLFQQELFTLGQAAEFLEVPQLIFQKELAKRKISLHFGPEEFREDLKTLESLK